MDGGRDSTSRITEVFVSQRKGWIEVQRDEQVRLFTVGSSFSWSVCSYDIWFISLILCRKTSFTSTSFADGEFLKKCPCTFRASR